MKIDINTEIVESFFEETSTSVVNKELFNSWLQNKLDKVPKSSDNIVLDDESYDCGGC